MIRRTALQLVPVLIAAASHAGEITIERRPFTLEKSFSASVLPDEGCVLLRIEPDAWSDYQIRTSPPMAAAFQKAMSSPPSIPKPSMKN